MGGLEHPAGDHGDRCRPPSGERGGAQQLAAYRLRRPMPALGSHRYFFKLYALDTTLELPATTDSAGLERAMKGHVLAQATLMGTYSRGR